MYKKVYNHLDSKGLLFEKHFGFHLTENAILQLTRDITSCLEKGEYTRRVFIVLSEASDNLDLKIDNIALKWLRATKTERAIENNT